ncbi:MULTISPECIES: carbohydrate ABC transporter permease [unclassified Paenibacillus]|uniref:carbohydrate ABC transporter permease n=1 Tax=unclassified Paenibacillus TaxID=185978 RepID=UPI00278B2E82|nr:MULTISPECIES: sugar ABC transporter permease [unclassified Paenibacillus]MDQ0900529.1 raffinose/stachyose/melibiose transport system permease protein [Paenibacillus sp. V4I7]MDQ0920965.1 raffinose/stachyose/melibiose transport system permease protein [Paenibacillus sp. V4I5]
MKILHKLWNNLHKFMALPAIILFGLFFIYPLTQGIGISLTDSNGISQPQFIGFQNFVEFFKDERAKKDVATTVLFALGSAPLLNLFGFVYALVLDRSFKGKSVVRAIIYLPAVISPLIMGYVWYFILQPDRGFLHHVLQNLNLGVLSGNWLGNPKSALIVLILINVWQFVGMTMIIYLAGLQSIPKEMYEACEIDGAGYAKSLWYITIPMLVQSIKINVVTNIIGSLSVFEVIIALTDGGPGYSTESLSIYILRMLYGSFTGYSTAVAMILFAIIIIPVFIFMKFIKTREFEM